MTAKEFFRRILGQGNESIDGKWQWADLLHPNAMINGLFGKDRTEQFSNGKFDWADLLYPQGIADAIAGALGNKGDTEEPGTAINGFTGNPNATDEEIQEGIGNHINDILNPGQNQEQEVQDKTDQNIEVGINGTGGANQSIFEFMEQQQKKQWEREDLIRAETQQREDTAYQRAVADMQAAGINPNLMNVSPASSGGGITSATGMNYTPWETVMKEQLALLEQEIENNFKGDENAKDRLIELIGKIANLYMLGGIMKRKGG